MQEEDAHRVIEALVRLLQSSDIGLHALVEQHLDAVDNGRIVEVASGDAPDRSPKTKLERLLPGDVRRRDLTFTEQLSGLFDLVEVAVAGTIDVEERAVDMAREFLPENGDPRIRFSDDVADLAEVERPPGTKPPTGDVRIVTAPDRNRIDAAREVLDTLRELRDVTDVSRADWLEPQEARLSSNFPGWRK